MTPWVLSPAVEVPRREIYHSPESSVQIKTEQSYNYIPPPICLHGVHRDNVMNSRIYRCSGSTRCWWNVSIRHVKLHNILVQLHIRTNHLWLIQLSITEPKETLGRAVLYRYRDSSLNIQIIS